MNLKKLFKDKILLSLVLLSLALILAGILLIYLNIDSLSYPLILHFNEFQGVDLVGESDNLWGVGIMAGVIFLINLTLAAGLYLRERILSYILLSVNLLISILSLIGISNIILLN